MEKPDTDYRVNFLRDERAFSSRMSYRTSLRSCSFEKSIMNYGLMYNTYGCCYSRVITRNIGFFDDTRVF